MKYEVLIKKSENDIDSYKFETIKQISIFMEISENQVRERISWYSSGLSKNTWHVNKYGISYQIRRTPFFKEKENRCDMCGDSGAVKTGEFEYSTCPCVSDYRRD
jgi:hypothetical protein